MRETKATRTARFFRSLEMIGVSYKDADKLRLIERTLHRWAELECGDGNEYGSWSIERDEAWAVERAAWPKVERWWNGEAWDVRANRRTYTDNEKEELSGKLPGDAAWRETGSKPYYVHHTYGHGKYPDRVSRTPTADREQGALKRLEKILANYPELTYYHQGDPRGCALWLVPKDKLSAGESLDSVYTRGVACCV